jgi:hypothetical protein
MRPIIATAMLLALGAGVLGAQQPDTLTKAQRDSAAAADSIRVVRELERLQHEPRAQPPSTPPGGGAGPTNPRLLPDISAVGDIIGDLSPDGSTLEDPNKRADIREVEVALQAAVDPYFRGDVFLGFSDEEGVHIEQAFLTTTALPQQVELRMGRYLLPVGKINLTHRHDLHTVDYPWMVQRFLGAEGLKGTGLWGLRVFAPFGFYQELNVAVSERFGEREEGLQTAEPVNRRLSGLAYTARLRNYWDLSEAANLELSGTAMTGVREQPITPQAPDAEDVVVNAVGARQSLLGADLTYRWRPLQQGLYKSFILQAEVMRQLNERSPGATAPLPSGATPIEYLGPSRDVTGAYAFARWQTSRRSYVGGRYDYVQSYDGRVDPDLQAASLYLEFFPSEFSKLMAGYERVFQGGRSSGFGNDALHRLLLQATFALGPHKPHPF